MAAPTNISFATATDLGTLPANVMQTVSDSGTTYTVYYRFIAPANVVEIGVFGFGDLTTYRPTTEPFVGPLGSETRVLNIAALNVPLQVPVTAGLEYFLKVIPNAGNPSPAVLTLTVVAHAETVAAVGSIAVNDLEDGFPLALLDATTDYTVRRFIPTFAAGDAGDTLDNGTVVANDLTPQEFVCYDGTLTEIARIAGASADNATRVRTCLTPQVFYVSLATNPITVKTITAAGAYGGTTWTLTGSTTCHALAANNTQALLYFSRNAAGDAIRTWTLATDTAAADLVAGTANYVPIDILVLADNTIIVGYFKSTATRDFFVKRYNAAGATLNTYTFGTSFNSYSPRLCYAIDPLTFWVYYHLAGANLGKAKFQNITATTGTVNVDRTEMAFLAGEWQGSMTATPPASFGMDVTCPFWIQRTQIGSTPTTTTYTIRRQRRFLLPSSDDNKYVQIPTLELLSRTGIGLTPDAWGSSTPLGADPQVMMRISKDGGKTWGPERWVSAGQIGRYKNRVRWLRATGIYRNAVMEITVDAPVDWQFLAVEGTPIEGSS